jgi:GTP-binding protein Era
LPDVGDQCIHGHPRRSIVRADPLYNGTCGRYTDSKEPQPSGRHVRTMDETEPARNRETESDKGKMGIVAVVGQTNVGKSTFLNAVLGRKLLITSAKPQTTRNRIRCILNTERAQIVFVDTPGLHRPRNRLGRYILREAHRALRGIDAMLYLVEPWGEVVAADREAFERWGDPQFPILLLVNKIDLAKGNRLEETLIAYEATKLFAELIPVSATEGAGLADVVETLTAYLPDGDPLFPEDVESEQGETFLISELIREKVVRLTYQEIPHSIAVHVKWFREREDGLVEIKAEIIADRPSQKGIIVGKAGRLIKKIGTLARTDIEAMLGSRVFLDLIVKVDAHWTKDEGRIQQLTRQM